MLVKAIALGGMFPWLHDIIIVLQWLKGSEVKQSNPKINYECKIAQRAQEIQSQNYEIKLL